jgi:hypothetical protein
MTDTITVRSEVDYACWDTPGTVGVVVKRVLEEGTYTIETPVADVSPEVIDALAGRWLDHLYAGLNRASPFTKAKA